MKQYNSCLDFFKGFACVFVVFMHCEFPGTMGTVVQAISRFCIPFFFMVSGYFAWLNPNSSSEIKRTFVKKISHILKIIIGASFFYLVFVIIKQFMFHHNYFIIQKGQLIDWLVFNIPPIVAPQYWFLFALLYVYLFYFLLQSSPLRKYKYVLAIIMFFVYFGLAQGAFIAGLQVPSMYYRNWLVEGFPFFMLGHWIHENQERIIISNKVLHIIVLTATLSCLLERYILGRDFGVNIMTIPQVFALFVYGVNNPTRHDGFVQKVGRDCSMLIYVIHVIVWPIVAMVYKGVGLDNNIPAMYLFPVIVLVMSALSALAFNYVSKNIKLKTLNKNA